MIHLIRAIPAVAMLTVSLLYSPTKTVVEPLDTPQKVEVIHLTQTPPPQLRAWLSGDFILQVASSDWIYLSENINNGSQLKFSDGSVYEIAPADRVHTSVWLAPFPAEISESGDPDYPVKIFNTNTSSSVKAKLITPPSPSS